LTELFPLKSLKYISHPAKDFDQAIDALFPGSEATQTRVVLVDGCSSRVAVLTESLFNIFGLELNYIGGGAGSINPIKLNFQHSCCLL